MVSVCVKGHVYLRFMSLVLLWLNLLKMGTVNVSRAILVKNGIIVVSTTPIDNSNYCPCCGAIRLQLC